MILSLSCRTDIIVALQEDIEVIILLFINEWIASPGHRILLLPDQVPFQDNESLWSFPPL